MSVYTVHAPPLRRGEPDSDPTRFAFVRDGFSVLAFLFAPLWMLWHRLWLAFVGYLVVVVVVQVALMALGAPDGVKIAVGVLLALLVGFEAVSLRRWTLSRRRWQSLGVVVADDLEAAERRFFDAWIAEGRRPALPAAATPAGRPGRGAPPDVVGLFPQPGAWR
jgi:Protein of unknown function (DUF2628)